MSSSAEVATATPKDETQREHEEDDLRLKNPENYVEQVVQQAVVEEILVKRCEGKQDQLRVFIMSGGKEELKFFKARLVKNIPGIQVNILRTVCAKGGFNAKILKQGPRYLLKFVKASTSVLG
jgi:hypothetical protein